jgi:hypothetical protein
MGFLLGPKLPEGIAIAQTVHCVTKCTEETEYS